MAGGFTLANDSNVQNVQTTKSSLSLHAWRVSPARSIWIAKIHHNLINNQCGFKTSKINLKWPASRHTTLRNIRRWYLRMSSSVAACTISRRSSNPYTPINCVSHTCSTQAGRKCSWRLQVNKHSSTFLSSRRRCNNCV